MKRLNVPRCINGMKSGLGREELTKEVIGIGLKMDEGARGESGAENEVGETCNNTFCY